MEESSWEQRIQALTCILTYPTNTPSLHSQLLISTQIPCYLSWDFPPFLCSNRNKEPHIPLLLRWGISLFFKRLSRLCLPETSWRCKCPFQQPPPLILSTGVDPPPPHWTEERRREYVRKRLRRKPLVCNVPSLIPFVVPNLLLFLLLFWNPLSLRVPRRRPWRL